MTWEVVWVARVALRVGALWVSETFAGFWDRRCLEKVERKASVICLISGQIWRPRLESPRWVPARECV